MKGFTILIPVALMVGSVSMLQANTILVPSQQPTIQAGIDAAVDGDTVLVADGTYTGDGNRDIDFFGKAIVVMSENGPSNCIIDCDGSEEDGHRGFYFHGEDSNSVVQSFTITNGYIPYGGGIGCYSNTTATITGNIITGNRAREHGGGIYCYNCSPTITNNIIM
jgi:predicted outer membrane repeat protein